MREFIFIWSIENISYAWEEEGENIMSPQFVAGPLQNTEWTLGLYPRGYNISDYISLFLWRAEDNGPTDITINFELSCISGELSSPNSHFYRETGRMFAKGGSLGFGHACFMKRLEVFGRRKDVYLPQDVLTLRCRMWEDSDDVKEFEQSFGHNRLEIERVLAVEDIRPENLSENTVHLFSKRQNQEVMSLKTVYRKDELHIEMISDYDPDILFFEYKLSLVDKRNNRKICGFDYEVLGAPPCRKKWRLPFTDDVQEAHPAENTLEFRSELVFSMGEQQITIMKNCPPNTSEFLSNHIVGCNRSDKLPRCPTISDDLSHLYDAQLLCDVELKTKTKSFMAHRTLLCARSPVFLAMLTGDMKEKGCLDMEDVEDNTLQVFLIFVYTDIFVNHDWDTVAKIYSVADKYQVGLLKLLCCYYFADNLNVDNVCELLVLADRHCDSDLKRSVDKFIWINDEKIFGSPMWKQFAQEMPLLAMSTMLSNYEERENPTFDDDELSSLTLQDDLTSLYQKQLVTDIDIETNSGTLPAHKALLCASSSRFQQIFTDLKEGPIDSWDMNDFDGDVVSRLLLFLYTDSLGDVPWESAVKLYRAANVYGMRRLQMKCSHFFVDNLALSNACDILLLAHHHRDGELKSAVEEFIFLHDEELFGSEEWTRLSEANIHLAYETMRAKYRKSIGFSTS